jgi:hypothetical protein
VLVKDETAFETWNSEKEFQGPATTDSLQAPVSKQIVYAWQLAYGREPSNEEFQLATQFLQRQFELLRREKSKQPIRQAMINLCQSLLSSNEFLYFN